MRVLITGAAGFIGSHLAEQLVARGMDVRGVDRLSSFYDPARKRANLARLLQSPRFEFVEGDVNELDAGELLEGAGVVYHLAGQPGLRESWGSRFEVYVDDNVISTQRLLEASRDAELERFVLASSSSIYGEAMRFPTPEDERPAPITPYGVTKLAAEDLCRLYLRAHGVPTVVLRYFTVFGPRQRPDMAFSRFISAAVSGAPIEVFGDGHQRRDFTFVDDAVEAAVAAGSRGQPGAAYNIAGGSSASVLEVLEVIGRLLGRELPLEHEPARAGEASRTGADTTAARTQLGWAPSVSLEQGLLRQLEAQAQGGTPAEGEIQAASREALKPQASGA